MRRSRQLMPLDESRKLLFEGSHGVLSLIDGEGNPYGVPLNYVYDGDSKIYFHCATVGYKLECINIHRNCSFCVIGQDLVVPEEFTSYFRSVIVSGEIVRVKPENEIIMALNLLCCRFSPGIDGSEEINRCLSRVAVLRLDIKDITGKEAIELVRNRTHDEHS